MKTITNILKLIKYPLLTEKSLLLLKQNRYILIVDSNLKKLDLRFFFNTYFNIKITKLNVCLCSKKDRRIKKFKGLLPQYKKFYIKFPKETNFLNYLKLKTYFNY